MNKIPKLGLELIKKFEGCKLSAYKDPLTGGLPITIGWGSTRKLDGTPFSLGDVITQAQADALLEEDCLKRFIPQLEKIPFWCEMSDGKKGALLSFSYNLGANFYGNAKFKTITQRLRDKQWDLVPDALFMYRNPNTKVEAGLARRRKAEIELWNA